MKKVFLGLILFVFCAASLDFTYASEDLQNPQQNGYNIGYLDGFQGQGYNNPSEASDDWKQGYHVGYFKGKEDGTDYKNGYQEGYNDAAKDLPATSPVGSSKYFIQGCIDGYNAYHVEFKAGRMDGYKDGYNGLPIKDLSQTTPTYQKGYRSGYDYAIVHGFAGN